MLECYTTLDEIVRSGGLEQIKGELNSYPLYTGMVRFFGFREIGIVILNDQKQEISRYASHNNTQGEITEIVPYFTTPSIVVQADEKVFVDILHRADWVKEHWISAIREYAPEFSVVSGQYGSLWTYLFRFFGRFSLRSDRESTNS